MKLTAYKHRDANAISICKKQSLLFLLFAFLLTIPLKMVSQSSDFVMPTTPNDLPLYEEGKLYLRLTSNSNVVINDKDNISNDPGGSFQALFTKYQVSKTERPYAALNTPELNRTYRISFDQTTRVDSFIIELFQISSDLEVAEKVPAVYTFSAFNDSVIPYHLNLLNADQAYSIYVANSPTTHAVVAIVDIAISTTHYDLVNNIGSSSTWTDVADGDNNPNPPLAGGAASLFTHGTLVGGVAGAVSNNTIGIASVGWNNKLMCVKATSDAGNPLTITNPYGGVTWASTHGAQVINMSWGSYTFSSTDYYVITAAKIHDVVLVAAAGNDPTGQPTYPAAYGEGFTGQAWEVTDEKLVVAVAALDQNNDMSVWPTPITGGPPSGSNFGYWVDIAAYGTDIVSTMAASNAAGGAINYHYGSANGTSVAAPQVAGIAGMMRSYDVNKTADQIIDCLINTANADIYGSSHPTNQLGKLGSGRADAAAALQCISSDCAVNPIAIIAPSSSSLCANITLTLTANSGANSYSWSTGVSSQSIVVNTPGVYSVVVNYTGCSATASINFAGAPSLSLAAATNTNLCAGYSVVMLSASGSYNSLVWNPGNATTNSVVVSPNSGGYTYTVTANPSCGGTTTTIAVSPVSPTPAITNNIPYAVLGSSVNGTYSLAPPYVAGWYMLTEDATVSSLATFGYCDVATASNVKLTVPMGSELYLNGTYLHSCGTDMWKGIEVQNASVLSLSTSLSMGITESTIIEDALTAISSTYNPSTPPPAYIQVSNAIFNKNYTDISLAGFSDPNITFSNVLTVDNSVFTCRNFSIIAGGSGMLPPWTYIYPFPVPVNGVPDYGLRSANSSTTDLAAPYLHYFTPTTLKGSYAGQPSRFAISLYNVGSTSGSNYYGVSIGDNSSAGNFNLFDNHDVFINAENSNITLQNNVFQNQKGRGLNIVPTGSVPVYYGNTAAAVMHRTYDGRKTKLDMSATTTSVGNRFWDCNRSVEGRNIDDFRLSNAILRSTHATSDAVQPNPSGEYGVNLNSDRMNYYMENNEFSNIGNCINVPMTIDNGGFTLTALSVYNNSLSAPPSGYMSIAANVLYGVLGFSPTAMSLATLAEVPTTTVHPTGVAIVNNTVSGAWCGINVNGAYLFPAWVAKNYITLVDDNTTGISAQHGIEFSNMNATPSQSLQQNIWVNTIESTSVSASAYTSAISLVYCGSNVGINSPVINCNRVQHAKKGFEFVGYNAVAANASGTQWRGNYMEDLNHGMQLTGNTDSQGNPFDGVLGQQGDATTGMGNQWIGGNWSGTNYGVYTSSSSAAYSPLYYYSAASYTPPNIGSLSSNDSYTNNPGTLNTSTGNYTCAAVPAAVTPSTGTPFSFENSLATYLANEILYHFLRSNVDFREGNDKYKDWFNDIKYNSNLEALELAQESLYGGDYHGARDILGSLTSANYIEENDILYYNLYANYMETRENGELFSPDDSTALYAMADLCPINYGVSIYKARALYSSIYRVAVRYEDCDAEREDGRLASNLQSESSGIKQEKWNVELFPNPASDKITIVSGKENEFLSVTIRDLTGRVIANSKIKTSNHAATMDINIINGAYMITITNEQGKIINKKLLIAK